MIRTHLNIPAYILFCVGILLPQAGLCQGFNIRETYERYMQTHHMAVLCEGDSVVVFGTTVNTNPPYAWRGFVAKKDTWGETSQMKIFYDDSLGLDMYIRIGSPVTRLCTGGYAVTGYVNVGERPFVLLINPNLSIKRLILIQDPDQTNGNSPFYVGTNIMELSTSGDIFISGHYQFSTSLKTIPFLAKLDSAGETIFVKKYDMGGMHGIVDGFVFNNSNIEISGWKASKLNFTGHSEAEVGMHYGYIWRIDTAGNLLSYSEIGGGGCLFRTNASIHFDVAGYRYITYGQAIAGTYNPMYQRCAVDWVLQKTDASGDIVWERKLVDSSYSWVDYVDIGKILSDGDVLLFGTSKQYEYLPFYGHIGCQTLGRLVRVSPQGEIRWDRYFYQPSDTCINFNSIFNFLYSTAEDAQGNIYAAGMSEDPNFAPQQQGWLLKMDADGCMQPGCNMGIGDEAVGDIDASIFPNPTTDAFWFYSANAMPGRTRFTLHDIRGTLIRNDTGYGLPPGTYVRFEVSTLPRGMYALTVENGKQAKVFKIMVK